MAENGPGYHPDKIERGGQVSAPQAKEPPAKKSPPPPPPSSGRAKSR
jgi:hypothetical protein